MRRKYEFLDFFFAAGPCGAQAAWITQSGGTNTHTTYYAHAQSNRTLALGGVTPFPIWIATFKHNENWGLTRDAQQATLRGTDDEQNA
jgi:hypothetical protein